MADAKLNIIISAKDQTKGVFGKMGKSLQKLGKVAVAGIGVATASVAALGVGIYKLAEDAASLEGIEQAFDGITEASGKSADAVLAAMREGSAGMITNRDMMESYNKAAQLVGDSLTDQLPGAMEYLGKVSAATGEDMGFMMNSLVTGIGRLSPMILDNLGITVDLAAANEAAAELMKEDITLTEKQAQQKALMNQVMEKLAENTANMPDLADSAAAAFESFKITMKNTKDEIGLALIPVVKPLMEMLGEMAAKILPPLVDLFRREIVPVLMRVADVFSHVAGFVGTFIDAIQKGADPMTAFNYAVYQMFPPETIERIMTIKDNIVGFIDTVKENMDKIKEFIQPITDWIDKNIELKDVLIAIGVIIASIVIPAIASFIIALAPLILMFAGIVLAVAAFRKAWEEDWLGIQTKLTEAWEKILPILQAAWEWISETVTGAIKTLRTAWDEDWLGIRTTLTDAWDNYIKDALQGIYDFLFTDIPEAAKTAKEWFVDELVPAMEEVVEYANGDLTTSFEDLNALVGEDTATAIVEQVDAWGELKTKLETFVTFWEEDVDPVMQAAVDVITEAKIWIDNLKKAVFAFGVMIGNRIAEAIREWFQGLTEDLWKVEGGANAVKTALGNLQTKLENLAEKIRNFDWGALWMIIQQSDPPMAAGIKIVTGQMDILIGKIKELAQEGNKSWLDDFIIKLLEVGSGLSGAGGGFAGRYEKFMLDPIKRELQEVEKKLAAERKVFETVKDGQLWIEAKIQSEKTIEGLLNRQLYLKGLLYKEEERVNRLRSQQDQLAFLQEQMNLIKLIKEHGLDTKDILGGMKLGLEASLPDLIDAMNKAMQAIIIAANQELEVGSPSKVFERLGAFVMQGFAKGIDASSALPQQAFGRSVPAMANNYNTSNSMGNVYINNPAQMSVYLRQQELVRQRMISRKI